MSNASCSGTTASDNQPPSVLLNLDENAGATSYENGGSAPVTCTLCPQSGVKGVLGQALAGGPTSYRTLLPVIRR